MAWAACGSYSLRHSTYGRELLFPSCLARPHFRDRSYFRVYLGVDEEDLVDAPGGGSLQTEGLFSSVALFVLTWTLSYSLIHAAA